jgi:uncharacterized protein YuzE
MSISLADIEFGGVEYDARGDVLYLTAGIPRKPARTLSTVEGHAIDYDQRGNIIGMILVNVRWILDREGELHVTLPERLAVADQRELEAVLA